MNAKKVFKNILFFLLVNLTVFVSEYFPQQIHFDRISTNNGLSNNLIYDILQDKSGFLWIATDDGLNRYDGYDFKVFRNDPNDKSSLSDNSVWSLAVDKSGKIWVGTKTGWINCYDPVNEKFSRWYIASNITKDNSITTIFTEDENKIWIGTYRSGLYLLNPKTGEIKNWTLNPFDSTSLTNNYISSIVSDKAGNLWIGTYNGLNKFNYKLSQNKFQRFFKSNNDLNSLSDNLIWSLTIDKADSSIMWIGTATDLTEFNLSTGKFRRHKISNPLNLQFGSGSGNVIPEIDKNQKLLWIDSYAGLLRYNLFTGNVDRFVYEKNNPNSLPSNRINKIYKDKSGVIWVGTDNGLAKFSTKNKKFNYSISEEINFLNSDELYDISINALTQTTDGTIWFGTEKGLFFSSRDNRKQTIKKYNLLGDINVWSLSADGNNNLWIGTYGKGIFQLDNNNRKLTEWNFVDNKTRSMSRFFNKSILIDDNNNIWIGYWGLGLAKLNPTTKEFTRWIHNNEDSASLSYDDVWVVYQDSRKRIWIGTNGGGLNIYDKLSNFFIHFTTEENSQIKLSSNSIYSICESKYGGQNGKTILWVGTNNGLNKITILNDKNNSLKNVTIKIYSISDGLPDNSIKSLVEDKSGNIWIGTSSGISLFNPLTERFTNFTTADGLVSNDMNLSSAVLLENGLILMGSKSGLNYFKPEEIKLSDFIPPIVLTDLKIFNKSVNVGEKSLLKKSITFSDEINIPYSDNVFSIHFAALDFTSASEIVYSYKLEGFDKDWNIETKNRFATYTNLNPGKYIFKLRATNSDGVWSDNTKTLTIIITPPWWQTYWAIGLYIIIFVLGVWGIIRFQVNREKLRSELRRQEFEAHHLRELEKMKSRFFANLSHEFRTPLLLIKGPLDQLIEGKVKGNHLEYYRMIKRNAERLQNLIDQLLELSQLESETIPLNKQPDDIICVLRNCVNNFIPLAKQKKIDITLDTQFDKIIISFDRDKFEKIINNLLSNAFKFTPENGEIIVGASVIKDENNDELHIYVSDTGKGISEEQLPKIFDRFFRIEDSENKFEGFGIGLALVKELTTIHNWDIKVESKLNEGTTFTIRIPLTSEELHSFVSVDETEPYQPETYEIADESNYEEENLFTDDRATILFVDDSEDVRIYVSHLLKKDYNLFVCSNAKEALDVAISKSPDLIISDVMMPEMDGNEFCRIIKTDIRTSHVPVILLTAKATLDSKIEGLETGADDYIVKPFESEELLVRIKNLIEQRRILREKFSKEIYFKPDNLVSNILDKEFLQKATAAVESKLHEFNFNSEKLAHEVAISRSHLNRKLRALTGQGAGEFIRSVKMKKAAQMILENKFSITQIAFEVGFSSPGQFSKAFKKYFGYLPSEFRENYKKD